MTSSTRESIHFVTGKLAEKAAREVIERLSQKIGFDYTIQVMPITVAALITPKWLMRHLQIPANSRRVILPGYLADSIEELRNQIECTVECGPRDIRDLPSHFGQKTNRADDFGNYSIEIIAEINYASRLSSDSLVAVAKQYIEEGANLIDLGCDPNNHWKTIDTAVRSLRDEGIRCSVDTFNAKEAAMATQAGAELVLSVNSTNREQALEWGKEVVIVPDTPDVHYLQSIEESVEYLSQNRIPFRIDPILEPIGCGFGSSLIRYYETRKHFPDAKMMMGIGNLTELTDCDSAGINFLLLALCEEWNITSILTTQVIAWARTSIRECDIARRMVAYALKHESPPKRLDNRLVMLRDPKVLEYSEDVLEDLVQSIKDNNYRIYVSNNQIHLISAGLHIRGTDPYQIMEELMSRPESKNVDSSHAFYLGFELSKALTALTLGKQYDQDVALNWGMLTKQEQHHRLKRSKP